MKYKIVFSLLVLSIINYSLLASPVTTFDGEIHIQGESKIHNMAFDLTRGEQSVVSLNDGEDMRIPTGNFSHDFPLMKENGTTTATHLAFISWKDKVRLDVVMFQDGVNRSNIECERPNPKGVGRIYGNVRIEEKGLKWDSIALICIY
ncbi:MAG: hypothetical protein KAQ98_10760 [Bacteriovoracaceae bacterium]|nr:hypothetical protein [Bacteriovoracaceae bacterium]